MKLLEDRIRKDGKIKGGDVLKVDLFNEIGKEFQRLYGDCGVTKILTIEASGIGIACVTAQFFHCPVIFAKKNKTKNIAGDVYTSQVESFTHGKVYDIIVAKEFLLPTDRVLLIDDFLTHQSGPGCGRHLGWGGHLRGKGVSARRRSDPQHGRPGGISGAGQVHERGERDHVLLTRLFAYQISRGPRAPHAAAARESAALLG